MQRNSSTYPAHPTLPTHSSPPPSSLLSSFQTDGVILPPTVTLSSTGRERTHPDEDSGSDDEGEKVEWEREEKKGDAPSSSSSSSSPSFPPSFLALEAAALTEAIAELGGSVVPKVNWSVPRDAEW